jgi:DNA-binding transcriptional MerR regulator
MKPSVPLFKIQQISQKCDVSKSTLRFWEKKFKDLLSPIRSAGGQRRYSADHVAVIMRIKALKEEGLSLDGIGERINPAGVVGESSLDEASCEHLADRIAALVRVEVRRFLSQDSRTKRLGNETARLQ